MTFVGPKDGTNQLTLVDVKNQEDDLRVITIPNQIESNGEIYTVNKIGMIVVMEREADMNKELIVTFYDGVYDGVIMTFIGPKDGSNQVTLSGVKKQKDFEGGIIIWNQIESKGVMYTVIGEQIDQSLSQKISIFGNDYERAFYEEVYIKRLEPVFSGCKDLTSITIPNSVTSIGDGAFSGCI